MRENAEQIPVRSSKSAEQSSGVSEGLDNHFSEMAHPRSNSSGTGQVNVQNVAKAGRRAVGSGLAAVRHRSQSFSVETAQGGKIKSNRSKSTEESDLDMVPEGDSQDAERKQASKLQQTKVVAYLLALTEQRKKEELEKKKREERSKRRMELLSARLLQEAAERKLMSGEDNVKHQLQAPTSTATDTKPPRKNLPPKVPKEKTKASNSSKIVAENEAGSQKTVKLSPEMEEAIVARLQTKKSKSDGNADPYNVPARDFSDWKRKNSVPQDAKVFSMTGWYPCVKQALLDRGWYFNSDTTSPHFDLKWTLRSIDVSQETLQPWQLTNHYLKNVAITTKVGLIKSLQSLVWLADVDSKDLIPRAYDLSLAHEMQAFIDDYRFQKAEAIVRTVYKAICGQAYPVVEFTTGTVGTIIINTAEMEAPSHASGGKPNQEDSYGEDSLDNLIYPSMPPVKADIAIDSIQINPVIFEAACTILENHLKPLEDSYIDDPSFDSSKLVTDLHWELINNYDVFTSYKNLPYDVPEPVDSFLREKTENDPKLQSMELKELKRRLRKEQEDREEASNEICTVRSSKLEDLARIHKILCDLQKYNQGQFGINSAPDAINGNLWIVKPAAKSRGRGIATFADLPKLLKYVEAGSGYSTQWIVQKYMENPLCIANRKFDLRQWVLVTSWNPLTLYFYDEFYARFSVEEYSTLDSDLENSFVHLVNNSIGKNSENFDKQVVAENGEAIDGFMWSFNSFREYVKYKNNGEDLVKTKIQPRMKVSWLIMST